MGFSEVNSSLVKMVLDVCEQCLDTSYSVVYANGNFFLSIPSDQLHRIVL